MLKQWIKQLKRGVQLVFWISLVQAHAAAVGAIAEQPTIGTFVPDSASIERYGPAYRYPQAGWIVLHIEGEPYERGYQHGRLMAREISEIVEAAAVNQSPSAVTDAWSQMRMLADALFLRRYEHEFLLEMKGIADGAAAAGAKFDGRPVDLVDIVAVNAWTEVEFLEAALRATPKGIEGLRTRDLLPTRAPTPPPERCSSFIATGPATADGQIVFGHITMWSLQPARHFNVWLDIKPARGHRVLMQSYPGGIQSTMDYYMNDAGLLVSETTLAQTRFNIDGQTESSRIRKAVQYSSSIDELVEVLKTSNNGLYTNEWLIGDTKTNEIAMFELGTFQNRLWRSSKSEWFGNTPGFYWGCNNAKDQAVRIETLASLQDRPANLVFRPTDRDLMWRQLYGAHKGKIDAGFGFAAFTTPPLAAAHSLDAKFTTSAMARGLKTYALFGPPLGRTWEPSSYERDRYGDRIKPLISNGWTLLDVTATAESRGRDQSIAVDLSATPPARRSSRSGRSTSRSASAGPKLEADGSAWHGTLLPGRDQDVWLAAAWADYERIVAFERASGGQTEPQSLFEAATDRANLALFPYRGQISYASRTLPGAKLVDLKQSVESNAWYDLASGKGLWLLAELRGIIGDVKFAGLMDAYGGDFAGKPADADEFRKRAEAVADTANQGESVRALFRTITETAALPRLELADVQRSGSDSSWHVTGRLTRGDGCYARSLELLVETERDSVSQIIPIGTAAEPFDVSTTARPVRLIVDPRNQRLRQAPEKYSIQSFERELDHALIVYGSGPESASHREAGELLQRRIATQWSNILLPIKSDREVTDGELRSNHLLLVGRPTQNALCDRSRSAFPMEFGAGSFRVAGTTYAHPASGIVAAGTNPFDSRYSIVVFAGLSAESTRRIAAAATASCEAIIHPAGSGTHSLVMPARDLIVEFSGD